MRQKIENHYWNERVLHSMLDTNSSISQGALMESGKIDVYNYLDMHAVINNSIIEVFSIKKLQKAFPENE
jgi:UDP-galactopyranose mutase